MAANTKSLTDPQGQHEDWLELHNLTNDVLNLTGMYLTDKTDNPKKWAFPENTTIPAHGYLLVWLDEDGKADGGLHANFKLSRNGETVMLVDTDIRGNQVLDAVTFEKTGEGCCPSADGRMAVANSSSSKPRRVKKTCLNKTKRTFCFVTCPMEQVSHLVSLMFNILLGLSEIRYVKNQHPGEIEWLWIE